MTARKTFSPDDQLAVAHADLRAAQAAYEDAALQAAQAPDDVAAQDEVLAVEREVADAQARIRRLEAAKVASGRAAVVVDKKAAAKLRAERSERVKRLSTEIAATAEAAARHLDGLAPLLAQLKAAGDERRRIALDMLRAASGDPKNLRRQSERVAQLAGSEGATTGLLGGVVRSGIGNVPGINPNVIVNDSTYAYGKDAYTTATMVENLTKRAAELDALLATVLS